jgi:ATP-binding protein involved in chromosome partitioning
MFNKLSVPVLGVIENMSAYHCRKCGHVEHIFGEGGGHKLAQEYQLPLLQTIPLDIQIREMTDSGYPPVVNDINSRYAKLFLTMARQVAAKLAGVTGSDPKEGEVNEC